MINLSLILINYLKFIKISDIFVIFALNSPQILVVWQKRMSY